MHRSIYSEQLFPICVLSIFDDDNAYGLFAHLYIRLNVFALGLSAIVWTYAFIPYNQSKDVMRILGLVCLITQLEIHFDQTDIVYHTATKFTNCMNVQFACKSTVRKYFKKVMPYLIAWQNICLAISSLLLSHSALRALSGFFSFSFSFYWFLRCFKVKP